MAVYTYIAEDANGARFPGRYEDIDSVSSLRGELDKMGYALVRARRKKQTSGRRGRISRRDVVTFAYKFAGMYSAGLGILQCLETLERQSDNKAFKNVISDIRTNVETGSSLKASFEKHREIFSDFFIGMLEAGELGGKLAEALDMTAAYLEKQLALEQKVKAAFAYPVIVTAMCLGVVGFLLAFVIPVFSKLYKQVNAPLPGPTFALIAASSFIRDFWWAIGIFIVVGVVLARRISKQPQVRKRWDYFKLNMPVFGKLNRMLVVSNFTRTFAMLSSVGVSFIKSLDMAAVVANNMLMSEITRHLQKAIEAGGGVADSLKKYDIFPSIIVQLAGSGEQAGALPEMMHKGADLLDKDIDRTIASLLVKLEPTLTLIMGAIVGFILMGAYLPMFDYIGHLK